MKVFGGAPVVLPQAPTLVEEFEPAGRGCLVDEDLEPAFGGKGIGPVEAREVGDATNGSHRRVSFSEEDVRIDLARARLPEYERGYDRSGGGQGNQELRKPGVASPRRAHGVCPQFRFGGARGRRRAGESSFNAVAFFLAEGIELQGQPLVLLDQLGAFRAGREIRNREGAFQILCLHQQGLDPLRVLFLVVSVHAFSFLLSPACEG